MDWLFTDELTKVCFVVSVSLTLFMLHLRLCLFELEVLFNIYYALLLLMLLGQLVAEYFV